MYQISGNKRPLSPQNIIINTGFAHHKHQILGYSEVSNHNKSREGTKININYANPLNRVIKQEKPTPFYSPVDYRVRNNVKAPFQQTNTRLFAQKSVVIDNKTIRIPACYNNKNIYYNRPADMSCSQQNSSSQNSYRNIRSNSPLMPSINPNRIQRRQHPVYIRPQSPIAVRQVPAPIMQIRYVSPPPNVGLQFHNNHQQLNFMRQRQILKPVEFKQKSPKVPGILVCKKPGIKRMNSQGSDTSSRGNAKIGSRQLVSIYHSKADNNNKNQPSYSIIISPESSQKQGLIQNTSTKQKQLQTARRQNTTTNAQKQKGNRYYSTSQGYTTTTNNTQLCHDNYNYNYNDAELYQNAIDQVTVTPMKMCADEDKHSTIKAHDGNQHIFDEEHKIAEILVQQLKLNYDYFNKNQITDRSISDHVLLE